jgi:hypothetical protein
MPKTTTARKAPTSIQVTADPASLLNALSKTFTNGVNFAYELVQNGGRARATRIDLEYDPAKAVFCVSDDGIGIQNWNALLAMATSGWDEATVATCAPYGIGFLAGLFACEQIVVHSGACRIEAPTQELRALKPVLIQTVEERQGTRIELHGLSRPLPVDTVKRHLRGYPVPVTFNGDLMERPCTFDAADPSWRMTRLGPLRLNFLDNHRGGKIVDTDVQCFLQGFPILKSRSGWRDSDSSILHLDPLRYFGRLPDRDTLIDTAAAERDVRSVMKEEARAFLSEQKAALPPDQFVRLYHEACSRLDCLAMLSDVPFIPASWITRFDSQPALSRWDGDEDGLAPLGKGLIARERVPPVLLPCEYASVDDDTLPLALYAWAKGLPIIDPSARYAEDHWLAGHIPSEVGEDPSASDIACLESPVIATRPFWGARYCEGAITAVEQLVLDGPLGPVELPEGTSFVDDDGLIVTRTSTDDAVRLLSTFKDEDDRYDEEAYEEDCAAFAQAMGLLFGEAPAKLLQRLVNSIRGRTPEELRGKRFLLDIDNHGRMTVSDPPTA